MRKRVQTSLVLSATLLSNAVAELPSAPALEPRAWTEEPIRLTLTPYGWGPSTTGTIGIDDRKAKLDLPIDDALDILEGAAFLGAEIQKGRWGVLIDGTYMNLVESASTPGPFFEKVEVDYKQATFDAGLFFRVIETERGWLDVLTGARYMYYSTELGFTPDYAAASDLSAQVVDGVATAVGGAVESRAKAKADQIANELSGRVGDSVGELADAARDRILNLKPNVDEQKLAAIIQNGGKRIADSVGEGSGKRHGLVDATQEAFSGRIDDKVRDRLGHVEIGENGERLAKAIKLAVAARIRDRINNAGPGIEGNPGAIRDTVRAAIREESEKAIHDLKAKAAPEVRSTLDSAEKALTKEITDGMTAAANADVSESADWVDFYVGLRGRCTLWKQLYAGARADIGGFGIGSSSDLAWQVFGGLGYQFSDHVSLELGWRQMEIDYDNGTLLLDLAYSGATAGLAITF